MAALHPSSAPDAAPPPPPPRRPRRLRRALLAVAVLLLVLILAVVSVLWWSLRTERGTAWALAQLPGVTVTNPRGSLLGDFGAEGVTARWGRGGEIRLVDVGWTNLRVGRFRLGGQYAQVAFDTLSARQAFLTLPASEEPPPPKSPPPQHMRLPVALEVGTLRIGEFHAAALAGEPLRELRAALHVGESGGRQHRIDGLSLSRGPLQAKGRLQLGADAPMPLQADLTLAQPATGGLPPWGAALQLRGPLAQLSADAALQVRTRPAQTLLGAATLAPFAAFPLTRLQARVQALDLSLLAPGAPRTALNGQALIQPSPQNQLQARLDLDNALPGPWDTGRVPLRELRLAALVNPNDLGRLQLNDLQALLGSADAPAGRLLGQGRTEGDGWTLQATLEDVRPARLDTRAPALMLGGQLEATGRGFNLGAAPAAASAPASSASAPAAGAGATRAIDLRGGLAGALIAPGGTQPLKLQLDAGWQSQAATTLVELRRLDAGAGAARLSAQGRMRQPGTGAPWQLDSRATVDDLDLRPWLPASMDSPLRRRPSRLAARIEAALTLPGAGPAGDLLAWLSTLQGQAKVSVPPSQLAELPLQMETTLRGTGSGLQVALNADVAGNAARAEGLVARNPAADRWQATLNAPALQRLSPLAEFLPAPAPAKAAGKGQAPRNATPGGGTTATAGSPPARPLSVGGALRAELRVDGRWPALRSQGEASAEGLSLPTLRLRSAQARWRVATSGDAPLDVDVQLADLALAGAEQWQRVPALNLRVDGSTRAHRASLSGEVAAQPPEWTDVLQPPPPGAAGARTRFVLEAQGGLLQSGSGTLPATLRGWQGRLLRLDARRAGASDALLEASDVGLEFRLADGSQPARFAMQPGRAQVLGAGVQWSAVRWQAGAAGAPALIDAAVSLEPLTVAPLLARLQPQQGWQGDLEIEGRAVLRSAPVLQVDVLVQRRRGDLSLAAGGSRRPMGLSALSLSVRAQGNTWNAAAGVAGQQIGVLSAGASAQTAPGQTWPGADTPLQGNLELRVADLGVWDPWLPVGWRLGGALEAHGRVTGRVGAPELAGRLDGNRLAVSNFVEGVRVRDGELRVALQGEQLRIERFMAHAGDGTVRLEGGARLGAEPAVDVALVADRFQALGRVDRRIEVSGRAQARLQERALSLRGGFKVDQGLIDLGRSAAPALSEDVVVVDDPTLQPTAQGGGQPRTPMRMDLDLRLDLGSDLRVRGKGINTLLAGELRVTAPRDQIAVTGTVRTVQGVFDAYGAKLDITRGLVTFNGPVANPTLDIEALRTDLEAVKVGVGITGSAQNPRVALVSTPEMADIDKLSWLTLGKASTDLAGDQTALMQRAALALLAGNKGSSGPGLAQRLGLDALSFSRGASGGLSDAVVGVGKQLSERFYVGYRQSLDATGGGFDLIYKIAERFTLRLLTGETTGVDLVWTWRWD
ncbi:translocation/assembly module TamB domain-containing protein [uncultured Azohydromonas sp.]|uniref:translocation/assembly module TamB domain-containing protein n=1 Tax=uncultured Azohydromonas sp. TaxID=487342 RepID=UPI0026274229|nr:translocation/assembly module TamB domain-containing protein [uncultured Azohydromonas sp.]